MTSTNPYLPGQWLRRAGGHFPGVFFLTLLSSSEKLLDVAMFMQYETTWTTPVFKQWGMRLLLDCASYMVEPINPCLNCGRDEEMHASGCCLFMSTKFRAGLVSDSLLREIYQAEVERSVTLRNMQEADLVRRLTPFLDNVKG